MSALKNKKRKWMYIQNPIIYGIRCNKCNGTNITWSEYEHHIWCYDCQEDLPGTAGIFDGPIAIKLSKLLGISFKRYYFKSGKIMKPVVSKNNYVIYRQCSKLELENIKTLKNELK